MRRSRAGTEAPGAPFAAVIAEVRPEIDRRLRAVWDARMRGVRRRERGVLDMIEAARGLTLRGGKRWRAAMLVTAYRGIRPRGPVEPALQAGVALELLQSYLLMQDDWMDGDATRRGGPSVHAALASALGDRHLGAASAILASDFTWGIALSTLTSLALPAARRLDAIDVLCAFHQDVVVGQQMDLLGGAGAADVEAMHALKTGSYTVHGPLALGAALAGASPRIRAALARYAEPLGVAFQLRDDLLGAFGSRAETGKPEGGDLRRGKRTAVTVEGDARLDVAGKRALGRVARPGASAATLATARTALEHCGARAAVEKRLGALCDRAQTIARRLPVTPGARSALAAAADMLRPAGAATAVAGAAR